ncbi:MAG: FeoA family protein [Eubacterium sp.]|nr:FeoA family protein [Eubacterium sp.]
MPLSVVKVGEPVRIVRVGGLEETHRHLEEMGFVPNSEVTVVNKVRDNLILQVRDSRVALDGALAKKIMVEEEALR